MSACLWSFVKGAIVIGVLTLLMVAVPWLFVTGPQIIGWGLFLLFMAGSFGFLLVVVVRWIPSLRDWANGE